MDHSLKIWKFDSDELKLALKASELYRPSVNNE